MGLCSPLGQHVHLLWLGEGHTGTTTITTPGFAQPHDVAGDCHLQGQQLPVSQSCVGLRRAKGKCPRVFAVLQAWAGGWQSPVVRWLMLAEEDTSITHPLRSLTLMPPRRVLHLSVTSLG